MDNPSPVGGPAAASLSPSSLSQGSLARSHELRWKQEKTDAGRGRPARGRGGGHCGWVNQAAGEVQKTSAQQHTPCRARRCSGSAFGGQSETLTRPESRALDHVVRRKPLQPSAESEPHLPGCGVSKETRSCARCSGVRPRPTLPLGAATWPPRQFCSRALLPAVIWGLGEAGRRAAPVVANGLVVAGLPEAGPGHAAVHVVAQQVLLLLRPVPLHHDGRLRVPRHEHPARRRRSDFAGDTIVQGQ